MIKTDWSITSQYWDWTREDFLFTYDEEEKQNNEIKSNNAGLVLTPKFVPVDCVWLKGLWLNPIDKQLYGFIDFFLYYNNKFYCTNEQLAELFEVSENTIWNSMSKLEEKWLIKLHYRIKAGWWKIRFVCMTHKICESYTQNLGDIENKKIENKKNNKNSIKHSTQQLGGHWSDGLTLSENVIEWLIEYNNIRKKKLEKLTDKWRQLVINKLKTLWHWTDEWMIAVLQQSIENGWEWLFEVKWFKPTIDYENDLWAFYNEMKRDYEWLKNKLWVEKFMQLKQKALRYAAENKLL